MNARFAVRPMSCSEEDLDLFLSCFTRNGSPRSRAALEWQYCDNPTKDTTVDFAMSGERLAAIYATLPVRVRVDGVIQSAVQSLDTMTDSEFRGAGLFKLLASSVFSRVAAKGGAFVYGFPNKHSAHGFFERLSWVRMDPVPYLVRPLRTNFVLRRLGAATIADALPDVVLVSRPAQSLPSVSDVERFDSTFDAIWGDVASDIGVGVERDSTYLNWRLCDKPGEHYQTMAHFDRGRPVAFVSWCVKEKHGARIGYLMEALAMRGQRRKLTTLVRFALQRMGIAGADFAMAWCFSHSPNFGALARCGFFPLPERFRPIELHFGARPFLANCAATVSSRSAWYISYLDSDTV